MAKFSSLSLVRLATCDPWLQLVMTEAIQDFDFSVLCGHRGEEEQNAAHAAGNSKLVWPYSKHNKIPSKAIDIAPYPIDWDDIERFKDMAAVVLEHAALLRVPLRWGGNWRKFKDYPHFELDT